MVAVEGTQVPHPQEPREAPHGCNHENGRHSLGRRSCGNLGELEMYELVVLGLALQLEPQSPGQLSARWS